ncbi:MAG: NADH-quinone oxidoreductase subunit A [Chloroflexi bacterium]|uniref:NADH-quinone oxidoreductase subunit A n=1 Tax=Candidatus Flexifilum breve TaxID=3140694 RepID=UPI003134BEC5|nr:NADH-quinone oxidoreductase subunit A [Chloroflexota bacterium]
MNALNEFAPIGVLLIVAILVSLLILVISRLFGPYRPTTRKNAPYESGMKPIGPANRRYSVRFYLIAVLFILFDIEVIFFLPWAVVFRDMGLYAFIAMGVFIAVLTIGLIYEWKVGALEWE